MAHDLEPMTFDDLTSAYRVEMKNPLLADVRGDFYNEIKKLQKSIQNEFEKEYSKDPDSIMCEGIGGRKKKVNEYAQKIIDLRMDKVLKMALRASQGAASTLENLTSEEREYHENILAESRRHRAALSTGKNNYVIPDISPDEPEKTEAIAPEVPRDTGNMGEEYIERPMTVKEEQRDLVMIRILEDLPRIAGPDRDYDLKKEDVVNMPTELANALINHEKAVLLKVTP